MEALIETGTLFISVIVFITLMVGVLSFLNVLFEFLFIGFECIWIVISGLFYYLPKWCLDKVGGFYITKE